jgi:hypothetical protein
VIAADFAKLLTKEELTPRVEVMGRTLASGTEEVSLHVFRISVNGEVAVAAIDHWEIHRITSLAKTSDEADGMLRMTVAARLMTWLTWEHGQSNLVRIESGELQGYALALPIGALDVRAVLQTVNFDGLLMPSAEAAVVPTLDHVHLAASWPFPVAKVWVRDRPGTPGWVVATVKLNSLVARSMLAGWHLHSPDGQYVESRTPPKRKVTGGCAQRAAAKEER